MVQFEVFEVECAGFKEALLAEMEHKHNIYVSISV